MPAFRAVLLVALVLVGHASAAETVRRTIVSSGLTRSYLLHVPDAPAGPLPLVLAFHGFTDHADPFRAGTGFDQLADQRGFVVAYPDALPHPELGGTSWLGADGALADGNAAFIADVIADVASRRALDPRRLYVTGMSQGGAMCYLAATLYPERFAAIAPVVATFPRAVPVEAILPPRPLPVLMINGTADPLLPYLGGVGIGGADYRPAPELAALIAQHDQCFPLPFAWGLPDWCWFDGCTVTESAWIFGASGSEVLLFTIVGGSHTWPGSRTWVPWFFGNTCYDIDAATVISDFFARHALAAPPPG